MSDQEEPELHFEPIGERAPNEARPQPPRRPAPNPPASPPREPAPPAAPSATPKAQPAASPPAALKLVPAGPQPREGLFQRDLRGRLVGDRFGALCPSEKELLQTLISLSHLLPLADLCFFTSPKACLLTASHEGLAREMFSARLDAAIEALKLARRGGPGRTDFFVGARGVFVPYTGSAPALDLEGDLPEAGKNPDLPRLLGPGAANGPWSGPWSQKSNADWLLRLRPEPGYHPNPSRWLLCSRRLFGALHGFLRDAGLDFSFASLAESLLLHVPELQRAETQFFAGLPEVELLWDPLADEDSDTSTDQVPALLIDRQQKLPLGRENLGRLIDPKQTLIFRAGRPNLVAEGQLPLTPGEALLAPSLADSPETSRPAAQRNENPQQKLHLPLRLVRRGEDPKRRTRGLLLTAAELDHLSLLRDHLPWAVTSEAHLAHFGNVAFLLLGREALWNLPLGLPYWGDDEAGMYLVQGYAVSPEVPIRVLRRAADVAEGEAAFLSPARLWCVPQQAFVPLAESLELPRDLSRCRLEVVAKRLTPPPAFPALAWPEVPNEEIELPFHELPRPKAPERRRSLQEEAQAALARGDHEKAAQFYERAGEFRLAAQLYDQLAAAAEAGS